MQALELLIALLLVSPYLIVVILPWLDLGKFCTFISLGYSLTNTLFFHRQPGS
jgi:hypothetical protein